ncbi:MAG: acylneuraminate cytidylyltransferase family protein [Flavobacteriales bacterium]|tara:strand:- start:4 stop:696 length:693 start_codon:yes stop_codon:yes gene_type:complete
MKTFAFIFARGGSKGLPKKNILNVGGLPLIAHSILSAKNNQMIDDVFVSTDSNEIAEVSKTFEAKIIKRPKELAQDDSSEWLAWNHAINYVHDQGYFFNRFISLPATAPLRADKDINKCLLALKGNVDVVITVTPANRNPSFNMIKRDAKGISNLILKSDVARRQDAPLVYDMTTVAYVTTPEYILSKKNLFEGNTYSVIIPKDRAIDIDDEVDFILAERLFEIRNDFTK